MTFPDSSVLSLHAWRPSQPSVYLGDDLCHPSQVTAKMPSQQHSDTPHMFPTTGFEEALCRFEIQSSLGCVFAACEPTSPSWGPEPGRPVTPSLKEPWKLASAHLPTAGRPTGACAASVLIKSLQVSPLQEDASREEAAGGGGKPSHPALSLCGGQQKGRWDWQSARAPWYRGDHLSCLARGIRAQAGGLCARM